MLHRNTDFNKTPLESFLSTYNCYLPHQTHSQDRQQERALNSTGVHWLRASAAAGTLSENVQLFYFLAVFVSNVRRNLATAARQRQGVGFRCELKTENTLKYTRAKADEPPD